ncbi:MAG: hypothetical protein ACTHNW_13430 [Mucilaginibacter sp.]
MITLEKAQIYARFNGDADMYQRINNSPDKLFLNGDWGLIDSLRQDYIIIKNGNASELFIEQVNEKARSNCDSVETIDLIKSLAV